MTSDARPSHWFERRVLSGAPRNAARIAFGMMLCGALAAMCSACGPLDTGKHSDAIVPLHWEIAQIDSIGSIPASEFVFLPSDRLVPGPSNGGSVAGGEQTIGTLDSAIAARLIFVRTAHLMATHYSDDQQFQIAGACRVLLRKPGMVDSMRRSVARMVSHLGVRRPGSAQGGGRGVPREGPALLSVRQAAALESLPVSAHFEVLDASEVTTLDSVAPRMLTNDLVQFIRGGAASMRGRSPGWITPPSGTHTLR